MSQEDQRKLFQAFEKVELGDRVALNSTGVGLGLVISNNFVRMLNQPEIIDTQIKVESEKDVGSKFSFTILEQEDNRVTWLKNTQDENYDGIMEEKPQKEEKEQLGTEADMLGFKEMYFRPLSHKCGPNRQRNTAFISRSQKFASLCTFPALLVVDDDIFNVTAFECILKNMGFLQHRV